VLEREFPDESKGDLQDTGNIENESQHEAELLENPGLAISEDLKNKNDEEAEGRIEAESIPIESEKPEKIISETLRTTIKIPRFSSRDQEEESSDFNGDEISKQKDLEPEEFKMEPFQIADIQEAWKEFASVRRKTGKAQEQHIFVQPYQLNEDGITLTLDLNNSLQMDILEEIKSDLVQYLRNKLQNDMIQLEVKLQKENNKKMLYTNQEKFNHMVEKNPLVADLQNKLGLDPDY
jgi:hypothetical protein